MADGLERERHAAGDDLLDRLHGVASDRRVDEMGGAELAGHLLLGGDHVDGDDRGGAGEERRLDGVEPDAADAEHRHAVPLAHPRPVEHRAAPVRTAQPMSAALSSGTRVSMGTAWLSLTTVAYTTT